MIDESHIEDIIGQYFKQKDILVNHHIESYNDLIDNILPKILSQSFPLTINLTNDKIKDITLNIVNININKP